MAEGKATCPMEFPCQQPMVSFDIGCIPSYVAISSSGLSCLGSLLILFTYATLKDMRTGAQTVITLLAVADFFTAFGYIVGSVNFILHYNETDQEKCEMFDCVCEIQSFITTWSTLCSYCWNVILAFYFSMVIVFNRSLLAAKLIPIYNIIAWLGPLVIMLPLLITGKLGYAPYVASNWCYIKDTSYNTKETISRDIIMYILIAGKLWEILAYCIIIALYTAIVCILKRQSVSSADINTTAFPGLRVEKRLLAIPLMYIVLRMWGTLQFFYSLGAASTNHMGCIPRSIQSAFLFFGILQAIGDGGQGWANTILYIFLSPVIRTKLFGNPCGRATVVMDKIAGWLKTTSYESDDSSPFDVKSLTTNSPGIVGTNESEPLVTKATGYSVGRITSTDITASLHMTNGAPRHYLSIVDQDAPSNSSSV